MPRAGLSTPIVVREAADLADEMGYEALTLTALASRLNVAVPSLYKHVGGLDDLRRGVARVAIDELGAAMRDAIHDSETRHERSEPAGDVSTPQVHLHALATAYRRYALDHPGRYAATVRAAPAGDRELRAAAHGALEPVFDVLEASGLRGDDLVHAARGLRAALHGFASLETAGGFGLPQDVDLSFGWMVDNFQAGLIAHIDHA